MGGGTPAQLEAALLKRSASGRPAAFSDGADGLPVKELALDASATLLTHTGKNLLNISNGTEVGANWTPGNQQYEYVITGLDPDVTYTLSVNITEDNGTSTTHRLYLGGETSGFISTNEAGRRSRSGKPTSEGVLKVTHNKAIVTEQEFASHVTQMQLEVGETMTDFEEPIRETYTITDGEPDREVTTYYGSNTFLADAGNVSMTYYADATLAYEQLQNAIVSLGGNV